ncbi:hypothetical protein FRB90_000804 [Tulasnella sp. 427]|nr:hypothetical protein FRB90_000804 [Tulasnella sp. 427]
MPSYLRRVNESWLAATIHHLLPDRNIQLFNRCLVLDEGLIDVVLHLLVGILAEIQYYIDKLETMLATEDLSRDIEGNRAQMLGCLSEFPRLFHTLLQMIRESPTCWRIVRCLSKVFEDRIVAATTGEFENTAQDLDDIGSLVNESDDNVDYGSPDAPIYEKVWTWLESLTDWAFILHHICSLDGGIGDHLRRGLTIRLWAPELREPIKQASLENTLAFVNWDPEEDRSLEALQNAALTHWNKTAVDPSSTADDHRPVFSISQRILLGLEDKSRWPNAFQGSIHCQGLLACLIKDQIIKARLMATSRRRCTCCNLLLRFIEPDMELSMASSGSKPLPWALPLEECLPEEIKDAILKALAIRLKQVLWAVGTDERRKAVETSSRVVTAKYVTLRKRSETRNTEE